MVDSLSLPHWDMSDIFPGLESPEFQQGFQEVETSIAALNDFFGGIEQKDATQSDLVTAFPEVIERYNSVLARVQTMGAYITAFVSTNSRDTLAQARQSEFQQQTTRLYKLGTRITAWIGRLDIETLIKDSPAAGDHAYWLRRAKVVASHLMSPEEEALAADLNVTGGSAWSRLHGNVSSQLMVPVELAGKTEELPMSVIRTLALDPRREVRRQAYEAELTGWQQVAVPLAAALNSIKGEVNLLAARRGWESPLDAALFDAAIDRETLDAMMFAADEAVPQFRRYLKAKARMLQVPVLAWYDLFAPIGESSRPWQWDDAERFIIRQFGTYSDRMSDFAVRAFNEHWIDAEPHDGKRDGAFCMPVRGDESRVFANFRASFDGVSTLAHELGHGYHNLNLARRTMIQRSTPMTLAETASIFCETIVQQAALERADEAEQLEILEAALQGSCQVVVDITSRFRFEQQVFESRKQRELSVEELCLAMLDAQCEAYGEGLDQKLLHPYMWAMKPHYYSTGRSFYNFPYMFGLLFGLGLYSRYQRDPEAFKASYDELLSSTGLADAATLAGRFGIDTRGPAFWQSSFRVIGEQVERFEAMALGSQ
ncbi:MAG: M3 family oligoendopeptidase [Ktedonobacterales bacterium]